MTITELIGLCERRLTYLSMLKSSYSSLGDVQQVERIDEEVAQTTATLNALKTLE